MARLATVQTEVPCPMAFLLLWCKLGVTELEDGLGFDGLCLVSYPL